MASRFLEGEKEILIDSLIGRVEVDNCGDWEYILFMFRAKHSIKINNWSYTIKGDKVTFTHIHRRCFIHRVRPQSFDVSDVYDDKAGGAGGSM